MITLLFFFYWPGDHRDLHSFPTRRSSDLRHGAASSATARRFDYADGWKTAGAKTDRKSTRLNSSHVAISYAVFCLKKKRKKPDRSFKPPPPKDPRRAPPALTQLCRRLADS